jgi:hypothetical protein
MRGGPTPLNCHFSAPDDSGFVNFDEEVAKAKEMWIAGLTLRSLTRQFADVLHSRVKQGLRLRLLIMHPDLGPDSNVLRATQAWIRSREPSVAELVADIEDSTRAFSKLKKAAPDPSQIVVRGHKRIMSFGLSIADPTSGFGQARINLYLFGGGVADSDTPWLGQRHPALFVSSASGPEGAPYKLLVNHFNRLWDAAEGDNLA